jgi:hypothetical protein
VRRGGIRSWREGKAAASGSGGFEVEGGGNWWIGEAVREGVGEIGFAGSKRSIGYIGCERDLSHPIGNGRMTIIGPVGPKWALLYSFFA